MIYRKLGKNGDKVSRLALGAMRLKTAPGDWRNIDRDESKKLIEYCFENGINYFDTAWMYHDGESEKFLGDALKPFRKEIFLATKSPGYMIKKQGDFRKIFDEQLRRLKTDYIDYYFLHGISLYSYEKIKERDDWLEGILALKKQGYVRHACFSFHGESGDLEKLIDLDVFDAALVQYNLIDCSNEAGMAYAAAKGVGVLIMGPVAGGRIADFSPDTMQKMGFDKHRKIETAFRFVVSNENVDCVLSGMNSPQMARENIKHVISTEPLSPEEKREIEKAVAELDKLKELYCTGCKYCMPCPAEVNIAEIFNQVINHNVYGMHKFARDYYAKIGNHPFMEGKNAEACTECGECLEKCPQKLNIIEELKKAHKLLS